MVTFTSRQCVGLTVARTLHERCIKRTHKHLRKVCRLKQKHEYIYPLTAHTHTHTRTHCSPLLVLLPLSPDSICSSFLPLSNLSNPAKICFLSPCGSVHTDAAFQLSEERQTENRVDQSEELLTVKCFTRWFHSFFFPPFLPFLPFFFMYHFPDPFLCLT